MMIPAPTPDEIFTNTELRWPRATPCRCSARAPRLASFSTWTGTPKACWAASWVFTPSQPGKIEDELTRVSVTGAGRPSPTWRTVPCSCAMASSIEPASASASWWACPGSRRRRSSARSRLVRSPIATATWLWPKSTPPTKPMPRASRTDDPRRPLPGSVSTRSAAASSRTMFETVAGASPVTRASSAWVKVASSGAIAPMARPRRTSRTRCRLAVRSVAVEPGARSGRGGAMRELCTGDVSVVKRCLLNSQ